MRKLFHAECPDLLGVPKGDIEVDGLADLRNMIKAGIEDVYIERKKYHDHVWGDFHYVNAVVLPHHTPNNYSTIGIANFYEE